MATLGTEPEAGIDGSGDAASAVAEAPPWIPSFGASLCAGPPALRDCAAVASMVKTPGRARRNAAEFDMQVVQVVAHPARCLKKQRDEGAGMVARHTLAVGFA